MGRRVGRRESWQKIRRFGRSLAHPAKSMFIYIRLSARAVVTEEILLDTKHLELDAVMCVFSRHV